MTDNVASLGFEVNSKPLDDAKKSLKDVATEAQNTGKAVDDLNQKTSKTGPALGSAAAPAKDLAAGLKDSAAAAALAGTSIGNLESMAKRANISVAEMAARIAVAKGASSELGPALNAAGAAAGSATKDFAALGGAVGGGSGGGIIGGLGRLPSLIVPVVAGFGGLALGATALLLGLAKVGDEVERTKNRLAGLTGSTEGGAKVFDAITAASKRSGVEASSLTGAIEQTIIGLEKTADKNVIYANTAEMAAKKTAEASAAIGSFGQILQTNLANADEEKRALNALGSSFEQTGTLGAAAFQKIRAESPSTALAIAKAFGNQGAQTSVKDFIDQLGKAPITLDQFVRSMAKIAPQIGTPINTVGQSVRELHQEWDRFIKTLSETGAVGVARDALTGLTGVIKTVTDGDWLKSTSISDAINKWSTDIVVDTRKWAKEKITDPIDNWLSSYSISDALNKGIIGPINAWLSSTSIADAVGAWAQANIVDPITKAIQAAASALSGMTPGIGSQNNFAGQDLTANPGGAGTLNLGDLGGGAGGITGAAETVPNITAGGDMPAFASGTDNAPGGPALINEQGGEIVNLPSGSQVIPHDISMQIAASGLSSVKQITDAISQSTIDITKQITAGSDNIVSALSKIGGAASSVNTITGLPVASTSSSTATSNSGTSSGGGGGFTTQKSKDDGFNKSIMDANKGGGGYDPSYQMDVTRGTGTFRYPRPNSEGNFGGYPTPNSDGNFNNSYAGGYSGYTGYSDGGSFGDSFIPNASSGNLIPNMPSGDLIPNSGTAYGANPSSDMGNFATGGKFTVGGVDGVDKNFIGMHVTKGETVEIKPPGGVSVPDSVAMPASLSSPAPASDPSQSNTTSTISKKEVNIYVHPGVQADAFLKSRAQIARGM